MEDEKEFEIGDLVTPETPAGVWTYKFCPDTRSYPDDDDEPGYLVFEGVGVILDKKLVRVFYKYPKSEGLKYPDYLDILEYQIGTRNGIVGWTSAVKLA